MQIIVSLMHHSGDLKAVRGPKAPSWVKIWIQKTKYVERIIEIFSGNKNR